MDSVEEKPLKVYLVYFEDKGYYAEKQSKYEWAFTDDHTLAKQYKTRKGAFQRLEHASTTMTYREYQGYIHPIIIKKIVEYKFDKMEKITNFTPKIDHKVKIIDEKYKVKVVTSSEDDPFWD